MSRSLAAPLLLGGLALLTLPVAGLLPFGLSLGPETFLGLVLLSTAFAMLFVAPWSRRRERSTASTVLLLAGVALPFVALGVLETPAPGAALVLPGLAWGLVVLAALAAALLPYRLAAALTVGLLVLFAGDALLGRAGARLLPAAWNPAGRPLILSRRAPFQAREAPARLGWRTGAPLPLAEEESRLLGGGTERCFEPALQGRFPASEALVLVLGGGARDEVQRVPDLGTFVPRREADLSHALLFDAFDAAVVLPRVMGADDEGTPDAARLADGLVTFTRRGGVLVGPAPERPWPPWLGRRLGPAGRAGDRASTEGRPLGLGRVLRAASDVAVREVLEREVSGVLGTGSRRTRTVFDPPRQTPPPWPRALERWQDEPPARRPQGVLLVVYALVAAALDRILDRRWAARAGALGLAATAAVAGLVSASPDDPGVRGHAVLLDLAGGGGRRLEAVALSAGPAAWEGRVRWESGGGILRLLGASWSTDGRVRVPARKTAWMVRDAVGRGDREPLRAAAEAAFVRRLLVGGEADHRIETGLGRRLPVGVEGVEIGQAWTLRLR